MTFQHIIVPYEGGAIVMSLRRKHRREETMFLSHTTSRILRHAPCHVVITYHREED